MLAAVLGDVENDGGVNSPYLWSLFTRALEGLQGISKRLHLLQDDEPCSYVKESDHTISF